MSTLSGLACSFESRDANFHFRSALRTTMDNEVDGSPSTMTSATEPSGCTVNRTAILPVTFALTRQKGIVAMSLKSLYAMAFPVDPAMSSE